MRTVIDLVLLAIIIISIWSGYKKGFILGIAGVVAIVVSLYGASLVSSAFSYVSHCMSSGLSSVSLPSFPLL